MVDNASSDLHILKYDLIQKNKDHRYSERRLKDKSLKCSEITENNPISPRTVSNSIKGHSVVRQNLTNHPKHQQQFPIKIIMNQDDLTLIPA